MTSIHPLPAALTTLAAVAALSALSACASPPPPTNQLAVSRAALEHAVAAGSTEFAPRETGLARDKMGQARQAMDAGDNQRALDLAQQAQLDAQLAEARTETAKSRRSADALDQAGRALREEMNRKAP